MIKLALDNAGKIVHINQAAKHIDYTCSDCGSRLRVRHGAIKIKHYYHVSAEDCGGTGESLVHKFWKDHFANKETVTITKWYFDEETGELEDYPCRVQVTGAQQEVRMLNGCLICDVVLEVEDQTGLFTPIDKVIVEICYKNPKTEEHKRLFKELGVYAFEVHVNHDEVTEAIILHAAEYEQELEKAVKYKRVQRIKKQFYKRIRRCETQASRTIQDETEQHFWALVINGEPFWTKTHYPAYQLFVKRYFWDFFSVTDITSFGFKYSYSMRQRLKLENDPEIRDPYNFVVSQIKK